MGSRGPKPGFKRAREEAAGTLPAEPSPAPVLASEPPVLLLAGPELTYAQRNNPDKLGGQKLRELAHQRGMSRSELERYGDDDRRIREQLQYLEARRRDAALA